MEDKFIQLEENNDVIKLGIKDSKGNSTGEYLEFDLEDIELLDKLQKMNSDFYKNKDWIKKELIIIGKKQDFMPKNSLMSNNQHQEYESIKKYYLMQRDTFNLFLGENGVEKLLNGRKLHWDVIEEIAKIINKDIAPFLDISMDRITAKIKNKYKVKNDEIEVLE